MLAAAVLLVAAAAVGAHWPALHARAVSIDDPEYLLDNPLVQNPSWDSAGRFLSEVWHPSSVGGYYQPLNMISLMLDCAAGGSGQDLLPFHRTSLALHAANAALVAVLLYLLFGNVWAAAMAALLFAVHPMTVETIPWIGERKTLLAAFFSLVCLCLYVLYARRGGWKLYAGVVAAYVLALMSKPTSTPLPAVMLLMDYWPLRRFRWQAVWEKAPLFALAGFFAIVTVISQSTLNVKYPASLGRSVLVLCHNVVFYLYKIVWPVSLSSHYPVPNPLAIDQPMVLAGVIGTVVLLAALAVSLRWTRAPAVGWAMFFVTILPAMNIIGFSNVIASDKFAYLPAVGLLMPLAAVLAWWWGRDETSGLRLDKPGRARSAEPGRGLADDAPQTSPRAAWARRIGVVALVVVLASAEAFLTRRYLADWRDTITLYRHMLACAPDSAMIHNNLGYFVEEEGKGLRQQAAQLEAAGRAAEAGGREAEARQLYQDANTCFRQADRPIAEARRHYEEAIRLAAGYADPHVNLGKLLYNHLRDANGAAAQFEEAMRIDNNRSPIAACNLGALAFLGGDLAKAEACYNAALAVRPYSPEAHAGLARVCEKTARYRDAVYHYRQALRAKPGDAALAAELQSLLKAHPEAGAGAP